MLKYRAVTFPLLLALLAAIFFWPAGGKYLFVCCAPLAVSAAIYECCAMVKKLGITTFPKIAAVVSFFAVLLLAMVSTRFAGYVHSWMVILISAVFLVLPWLAVISRRKEVIVGGLTTFGIAGGLTILYSMSILLYGVTVGGTLRKGGISMLLIVILITKAMDTGGYIFGMISAKILPNGNHKIVPKISPKKSWEGIFGGLLLSMLVSLIFYRICGDLSLNFYIVAGAALGIGSFLGDITESALKRCCDIKDSGKIIPGMGGVFDVMDSLIYSGLISLVLLNMVR